MSFSKKIIASTFLFLYVSSVFADQAPCRPSLEALLQNMKTFQAGFTQSTTDLAGVTQFNQSGRIAIQTPGFFYWGVQKPSQQTTIALPDKLVQYDPDLQQENILPLAQIGSEPAAILSGGVAALKDYQVVCQGSSFTLKPDDLSGAVAAIHLYFLDNVLQSMTINQNAGMGIIHIQFLKPVLNDVLPDDIFKLVVPKGVEVIDQRPKPHE